MGIFDDELSEADCALAYSIMAKHGIEDFGGYVSAWPEHKKLVLDGLFTAEELACLAEIAKGLEWNALAQGRPE